MVTYITNKMRTHKINTTKTIIILTLNKTLTPICIL